MYLYESYWFWRTVVPSHASPPILQKTNTNTTLEIEVRKKKSVGNAGILVPDDYDFISMKRKSDFR